MLSGTKAGASHPVIPGHGGHLEGQRLRPANDQLTVLEARNHALRTLLAAAYDFSPQPISGVPDWSDAEHYDIVAKTPGETRPTLDRQMPMLRRLLDEQLHLVYHREPKEMPIYSLTVAKSGVKLRLPALAFVICPGVGAKLPARDATVGEFASVLQRAALPHPVIDQTGIRGRFDFDLEFLPDEEQLGLAEWKANPDHPVCRRCLRWSKSSLA